MISYLLVISMIAPTGQVVPVSSQKFLELGLCQTVGHEILVEHHKRYPQTFISAECRRVYD
jgi:hypothetical protein